MITLVDYGLGNIQAFANIYRRLNVPVTIAKNAEQLASASKIILPGVGAFDSAMQRLTNSGMKECLDDLVLRQSLPILGVCVGMQIMAHSSEEGKMPGLGWIDGQVKRFALTHFVDQMPLPHMGWNKVKPLTFDCLFDGLSDPEFYFLHSYYFLPVDQGNLLSLTNYGISFASSIRKGNVFGTQFHPEKSHGCGVQILKNFAEI